MGVQKTDNGLDQVDHEALQLLQEVCAAVAAGQAGDEAVTRGHLRETLGNLSEQDRARLTETFRRILAFQPPPSRSSQ